MLVVDFYGYSILTEYGVFLFSVHILTLATVGWVNSKTQNTKVRIISFIIAAVFIFTLVQPGTIRAEETESFEEVVGERKTIGETFKDSANSIFGNGGWIEKRIKFAVTGKVEKYDNEAVGVCLESVKSADRR